jgi:hypothetical protein
MVRWRCFNPGIVEVKREQTGRANDAPTLAAILRT